MDEVEVKSSLTEELRQYRREHLKDQQESNRLRAFDSNRFVESEILTEQDVVGLCSRIKRRKRADAEDLEKLCSAFIQKEINISAFMKVTGAINIVVKEFTGNNRSQQLRAANALCNLSLGDEACCAKLATFAGSYLMIFIMKSDDHELSKVCLWITQNIVASGCKPLNILMSQELLKNCLHILNNSIDNHEDALILLDLIIDGNNDLNEEEKRDAQKTIYSCFNKSSRNSMILQLFYKLKIDEEPTLNVDELLLKLSTNLKDETTDEHVAHFSIQILIKLFRREANNLIKFIDILETRKIMLSSIINSAAENPKLFNVIKDFLSLLSLLSASPTNIAVQYFSKDSIDNLKIPKLLEL